jgi:hypothetical protein
VVKPLVAELSTKIVLLVPQGLHVLFYRAALPLSHQTLTFVSGLVRAHRRELGSPWRALNPGQQALLVLVYLHKGEPFAQVGAGFGVSTTTCWRYVNETVELLAARAPKLRAAPCKAKREGMAYVVIDGTLIPIDPDCPRPAVLLSRHGARCRCCHRSVSPCRSPNPACDFHRTGLSTVSGVGAWLRLVQGLGIVLPR